MRLRLRSSLFISLVFLSPLGSSAQNAFYSDLPVWTSNPVIWTYSVAVGDIDADGDLDLICGNYGQNSLYLNVGGRLNPNPAWQTSRTNTTKGIALGDIDGDGDLDLVCGNDAKQNILYENIGGTFSNTPLWFSGPSYKTQSVALGDIDGDGDLDLVCGNGEEHTDEVNTLYENIGGTFSSQPIWTSGIANSTHDIALGDVDGDGDLDLVCANYAAANTLYENVDGIFSPLPVWSSDSTNRTECVALGDVDGDGDLDLVCGNSFIEDNTLYRNVGGTFTTAPVWTSESDLSALSIELGDVDRDDDLDLVCGNSGINTVYENIGGTFSTTTTWESIPTETTEGTALVDIDGDGDLDLVCGNVNAENSLHENLDGILALRPAWQPAQSNATRGVALGDTDGDGDLDLVCGNGGPFGDESNTLYENNGGIFSSLPIWSSDSLFYTQCVLLRDIDGDGAPDLLCGNRYQPNTLYDNIGGVFAAAPVWYSDQHNSTLCMAVGDIDRDGDLDLVCGNTTRNTLYLNINGTLASSPSWVSDPANSTYGVALLDMDEDGDLDLVCGNGFQDSNTWYENTGSTFSTSPVWLSPTEYYTLSTAVGDIDGDGDLDLVCGNQNDNNMFFTNDGGVFSPTPFWLSGPTNTTYSVALGDMDGDGDLDLVCGNGSGVGGLNTLYENIGGTFAVTPLWSSEYENQTYSIVLGDIDGDSDLDLVCGNYAGSTGATRTALYRNATNPIFPGDLFSPANQMPNSAAFIGWAAARKLNDYRYRINFEVYDVESDDVWIVADYQFVGDAVWRPADLPGGTDRFGPIPAPPGGVVDSVEWDITRVPFDHRDVILRLRTVEIPRTVSVIRHAASYRISVGSLLPLRPELSCSADSLLFSQTTITVGDSTSRQLVLSNTGTLDLQISQIELPSAEMRTDRTAPYTLGPSDRDTVTIFLEPRTETKIAGAILINSDDPVTPVRSVVVTSDIRPLLVTNKLLKESEIVPLGEAVTVVVTPAPQVNVERGSLLFRPAGSPFFQDSIPLVPFETDYVAIIPGEKVTEAGIEYFIRVENSGVFGTDPPNAPDDSVFLQAVKSPDRVTVSPKSSLEENRDIELDINLPQGALFVEATVFYRMGGAVSYDSSNTDVLEATIPAASVGYRGIEYWARVATLTQTLTYPAIDPSQSPSQIPVLVMDLKEPKIHSGGTDQSAYRIITIPLQTPTFSGSIESMLSDQDEFGPYDPVRWRLWRYIQNTGSYLELSDNEEEIGLYFRPYPGTAFWLICANDHQISTAPVLGFSNYTISPAHNILRAQQWNMIGHPFAFPVAWDSVLVDSVLLAEAIGTLIDPPLRWAGAYREHTSNLEPFEGYWIYNRTARDLTILIPAREASDEINLTQLMQSDTHDGWRCRLKATSAKAADDFNYFGATSTSNDALDRNDRLEPPPPPGGISLYFVSNDENSESLRFAVDMRSDKRDTKEWGSVWPFDILKSFSLEPGGDAVTIAIDTLLNLPDVAKTILIDCTLDRRINLGEHDEYTFYLATRDYVESGEEARFRLIAGTDAFVESEASRLLNLPTRATLYQNYPNPFNPATMIRYDIAEAGMVQIKIYDVTGAIVKTLESRHRKRGRYEIGWNGENDRGEAVASGIYFYRLAAPGYTQTRKMVLVR